MRGEHYRPQYVTLGRPLNEQHQRLFRGVTNLLEGEIDSRLPFYEAAGYHVRRYGKLTLLTGNLLDQVRRKAAKHRDIHDQSNTEIIENLSTELYATQGVPGSSSGARIVSASTSIKQYGSDKKPHAGLDLVHPQLKHEERVVAERVNQLAGDELLHDNEAHITFITAEPNHPIQPFMWDVIDTHRGNFRALHLEPVQIFYPGSKQGH